ncbi:MAG: lytic transglycosylase domain-containing protein [Mesorhizobium sp.]|nr:lytic transglycosylase domain-containing protein [Mesorhizobium sp.]MCO5159797.1 lytic transglycosylase domain-containing protein [Mesorhizobium sp.]
MSASSFPYRLAAGSVLVALAAGGFALGPDALTTAAVARPPSIAGMEGPRTDPDGARLASVAPTTAVAPALATLPALTPPTPIPADQGQSSRPAGDLALLKLGLAAIESGDVAAAIGARNQLRFGSLDHDILTWAITISNQPAVPGDEIETAIRVLAGWPGIADLRRNTERALLRENADPKTVAEAFSTRSPETIEGARILARAQMALGDAKSARATLASFWRGEKLEAATETAILKEFSKVLSSQDHRARMEYMLYNDRTNSAMRVAGLAAAEKLAFAWSAVIKGDRNARKLLNDVPKDQRSAGYFFASAKQFRRAGKYKDAAAEMLKAPTDKAALADPDAWWVERRVLVRELLDLGDHATAYRLAAAHAAESPSMAADAEFHAGWIALRMLNDPKAAATHFGRIAEVAEGPISRARAYYWLGRAADAGAAGDAKTYYEKAAENGTAFYGQLAAQKLGRKTIPIAMPTASDDGRRAFEARDAVAAIRRIEEAGSGADRLYRELAGELSDPGELALLAGMAEARGDHYLALRVGKIAAARGIAIGSLAHPTGAIPETANLSGAGKALAYAIARQESEFKVGAISGAGAQGLLQLLPDTAKEMAKKAGMPFSKVLLTTDPGYNATLGSEFLSEQLGRFSGSYVLTFAGYNAGPRRAQDWIKRYGDPRGKPVEEVVDWIERIPFTETRHYVQRVMENYQVYKMRLTGTFDIVADLVEGR